MTDFRYGYSTYNHLVVLVRPNENASLSYRCAVLCIAGASTASAKGNDIRTLAVSSATVDQSNGEPSYLCDIKKKPKPNTNDGMAKYRLPEKATMALNTLEKGCSASRVDKLKFRLLLLSNTAMNTVNTLETVANMSEVIKDFTNSGSTSMRVKSAFMPSKTMTTKGSTKKSVNTPMISHWNYLQCFCLSPRYECMACFKIAKPYAKTRGKYHKHC